MPTNLSDHIQLTPLLKRAHKGRVSQFTAIYSLAARAPRRPPNTHNQCIRCFDQHKPQPVNRFHCRRRVTHTKSPPTPIVSEATSPFANPHQTKRRFHLKLTRPQTHPADQAAQIEPAEHQEKDRMRELQQCKRRLIQLQVFRTRATNWRRSRTCVNRPLKDSMQIIGHTKASRRRGKVKRQFGHGAQCDSKRRNGGGGGGGGRRRRRRRRWG